MSEYIHKSHNVSILLYHLVFPAKYRRAVFDESVDEVLREVCLDIEKRYEIKTGDTLQSISTQFYGTPEHYLSIYRANRGVLDRITSSPVGVVIEIPNIGN